MGERGESRKRNPKDGKWENSGILRELLFRRGERVSKTAIDQPERAVSEKKERGHCVHERSRKEKKRLAKTRP